MTEEIAIKIPADKPYAVIELPVYDVSKPTVYAVPACTTWLENIYIKTSTENDKAIRFASICKWPQDESKLSDYLERKKRSTDTWITYKTVKILKLCKSIREAKEETEKALDISDLSESDKGKVVKRQRVLTQRYSPSIKIGLSSESKSNDADTDTDDSDDAKLKTPIMMDLQISRNKNNNRTSFLTSDSSDIDEENIDNTHKKQTQNIVIDPHKSQVSENINGNVIEKVNFAQQEIKKKHMKTANVQNSKNNQDKLMSGNENNDDSTLKFLSRPNLTIRHESFSTNLFEKSSIDKNEIGGRTIMAAINDIRGRIDMLQITITKIYTATCSPVETAKNHIGIPNLPLLFMKEWNKWENFLSEEENKLLMVGLLAEYGKDDVKSSVYAIMRKILSNKVAMHFNLKGINREGTTVKKTKFQNTLSHGAIIAALKRHRKDRNDRNLQFFYNRETADSHIANWLKDAKKRFEQEELRLKKNQQKSSESDSDNEEEKN